MKGIINHFFILDCPENMGQFPVHCPTSCPNATDQMLVSAKIIK